MKRAAVVPVPGVPLLETGAILTVLGKLEMGRTIPCGTPREAGARVCPPQAVAPPQPQGEDAAQLPSLHRGSTTQSPERCAQKEVKWKRFRPGFQPTNPLKI